MQNLAAPIPEFIKESQMFLERLNDFSREDQNKAIDFLKTRLFEERQNLLKKMQEEGAEIEASMSHLKEL